MIYTEFRKALNAFPSFSTREIEKYFPDFDSRRLVEWQSKGYIKKLRNRHYYFTDQVIDESFLYSTANDLYNPSYVSLESAFSLYNFIPEGVFQITSCTTLKTNTFETPLGNFTYRHLKQSLYFGYRLQRWKNHHYVIAEPEKAIIDYLYLHSDFVEVEDFESLRWNATEIKKRLNFDKLGRYELYINSPALSKRIQKLKTFLNAHN